MPKRESQTEHDSLVARAAEYLVQKGYTDVKADVTGWATPEKKTWKHTGQGHIPDATGQGNVNALVEVETADPIYDEHTEDQWTLFATYAKEHSEEFWVLVPKGSEDDAKERLTQLGITGHVWAM